MRGKLMAASAALAVAAGGGAVAAATAANAATSAAGWLSITLKQSNDGAMTAWNNGSGDPLLTVGYTPSTTYAEMAIGGWNQYSVNGSSAPLPSDPATIPMFDTDHYGAGSPRLVIELNNGHSIWGYPPQSGLNGTSMAWTADNGNTYGSYQTAYDNAGANVQNVTVKDAFIVADGDQAGGTTDTISHVEYNGYWVAPPIPVNNTGGTMKGYASKCVDDYRSGTANGTKVDQYSCNGTNAQNWWLEPDGTVRNHAAGPTGCLDDTAWGGQGKGQEIYNCVGQANQTWTYQSSTGHLVNDHNGLCLNDPGYSTSNGTQLILWACGNYANEHFTKP